MKKKIIINQLEQIIFEVTITLNIYESNSERNKTLPVEEYLNKIRPYLKDIINNLKI